MRKLTLPIALLGLALAGCGAGGSADQASAAMPSASMAKTSTKQPDSQPGVRLAASMSMTRAIVRSATLGLRVDKVDRAEKAADAIINGTGGYVDSVESTDLATPDPKITIRARIPVATFDSVLDRLEALGVRLSKTVRGEDVTEKLVDYDARLKTMQAQEEVYRGMLRHVGDLTASTQLQDKLMALRADIESMAAQRKSLSSQAALSTIEPELQQQASPAVMAKTDPEWSSSAWSSAQSSAVGALHNVAIVLMWIAAYAPIWVPLALLGWLGQRLAKRRRKPEGPVAVG